MSENLECVKSKSLVLLARIIYNNDVLEYPSIEGANVRNVKVFFPAEDNSKAEELNSALFMERIDAKLSKDEEIDCFVVDINVDNSKQSKRVLEILDEQKLFRWNSEDQSLIRRLALEKAKENPKREPLNIHTI